MISFRVARILIAVVLIGGLPAAASARTVGQVIDDTTIATEIKAKLVADKLSNLTHVSVKAVEGVVTLSGEVDSVAVRDRAVQIASGIEGVRSVIDNIRLSGAAASPAPPAPPSASPPSTGTIATAPSSTIDANGIVARVDPQAGTLTLQDGRVIKAGDRTVIWQPVPLSAVQPGTQVSVRLAQPLAFQPGAVTGPTTATAASGWRMGTVSRVDTVNNLIVLTDGTTVRVGPSTRINVGGVQVPVSRLEPGSEVVIRHGTQTASLDASDVDVVWTVPR